MSRVRSSPASKMTLRHGRLRAGQEFRIPPGRRGSGEGGQQAKVVTGINDSAKPTASIAATNTDLAVPYSVDGPPGPHMAPECPIIQRIPDALASSGARTPGRRLQPLEHLGWRRLPEGDAEAPRDRRDADDGDAKQTAFTTATSRWSRR
jgi:hypothetical protein